MGVHVSVKVDQIRHYLQGHRFVVASEMDGARLAHWTLIGVRNTDHFPCNIQSGRYILVWLDRVQRIHREGHVNTRVTDLLDVSFVVELGGEGLAGVVVGGSCDGGLGWWC